MTLQIIFRSILVFVSLSLIHCAELQKSTAQKGATTPQSLTEKKQFESHPDWLALNLNPAGYIKLLQKIKTKRNLELKGRGEAHITLLTPPEFRSFQGQIPMSEIEAATMPILEKSTFEVLCLGSGKLNRPASEPPLETFFVVVQSKDLFEIRKIIHGLAQKHNVAKNFAPEDYYPHVTVGFTARDLHQADGVIKDKGTCQADLASDLSSVLKD